MSKKDDGMVITEFVRHGNPKIGQSFIGRGFRMLCENAGGETIVHEYSPDLKVKRKTYKLVNALYYEDGEPMFLDLKEVS